MASPEHGTKRRRLFRRGRADLPPVNLSPDEWIASLVAEPSKSAAAESNPDSPAVSLQTVDGDGRAVGVAVIARPSSGNGHGRKPSEVSPPPPEEGASVGPKRFKRRVRRVLVGGLVVLVVAGSGAVAAVSFRERLVAQDRLADTRAQLAGLRDRIASLTTERDALQSQSAANQPRLLSLEADLAQANAELARLRETVQQQEAAAAAAKPALVPNGKRITVELTGYEGVVQIHDVHLTKAYGFSDLIGIAVNESGKDIAYAQLGCTLLDAKGRVLANVIDNRENWPAGASWGFDCTAEVDATGGIVRVDSAS
jgi:hypothetical protein